MSFNLNVWNLGKSFLFIDFIYIEIRLAIKLKILNLLRFNLTFHLPSVCYKPSIDCLNWSAALLDWTY